MMDINFFDLFSQHGIQKLKRSSGYIYFRYSYIGKCSILGMKLNEIKMKSC